ncbi:Predicted arabinose efflux permease, MFS family [Tangfeifania diversioriginum]|uniref:Predicted arabinose efflux permease, MFS family n=1 Tax=Tangfeifania diversioriginum TaxID=1168035 RepID=A0A1M6E627_9BACT|nr:MFS transporter [Tangfeifania diversioriginum]SHI80820.1 Predicted arabinose efflux permease, MFS family [Tangfeifania diversioriginum]
MEKRNIAIIYLITLVAVMGVASITPAFPSIREHFNISASQVTLLITVFTFPGIFLAPVVGLLADRWGRKTILLPSLFLFGIAGAACFFTNKWEILLLLRFFQGIGSAALGSLNVTLIGDLFSGQKRSAIMGYNASVLSVGTAAYPAVGGALAMAGWQFPFLLPLLAIPTGLLIIFYLKNPEPKEPQTIGSYLKRTWKNINKKTVWGLFIINVLLFFILYGAYLSYFPQLMVERLGATDFQIGLFMSGFSVVTAITSSQLKVINRYLKPKKQLTISFILYFVSMILLSFSGNWWLLIIPLITFGMGHGMLIPGIQTLLVGFAPLNERAGFMSINGMVLRLGQTLGPLFIGVFYAIGGTGVAFLGGALVAVAMIFISIFMVKL